MNKKLVFFAFLLITITTVLGQKKSVEILGKVTDSLDVVANAHIVNLQTEIGTFSKDNGSFLIPVQLGDSLSISSVQHQTSFLIISSFVLKRKKIAIYLKSLVYRLDTFELKKHNLIGVLGIDKKIVPTNKRDSLLRKTMDLSNVNMKVVEADDYTDTRVRPPIVRTDPTMAFIGAGAGVNIAWKNSEKYWALIRELEHKKTFPSKILIDLGGDFFFQQLRIPVAQYYHFLEYCNPLGIETFYKNKNLLKVIEILEQESTGYLKIIEKK